MYLLVLKQLVIMVAITLAGYIFARIVKVSDEQQKFMSRLLLYFINPFLVLNSFNMEFSWHKFGQLWFAALIALVMHCVMILLGAKTRSKLWNSIHILHNARSNRLKT